MTRTAAKITVVVKMVVLQGWSGLTEDFIIYSIFLLMTMIYTGKAATLRNT